MRTLEQVKFEQVHLECRPREISKIIPREIFVRYICSPKPRRNDSEQLEIAQIPYAFHCYGYCILISKTASDSKYICTSTITVYNCPLIMAQCYKPALIFTPRTTSLTIRSHMVTLSISSNDPSSLVSIFRSSNPRSVLVSSSSVSVKVVARDTHEDCVEYMDDTALLGGGDG